MAVSIYIHESSHAFLFIRTLISLKKGKFSSASSTSLAFLLVWSLHHLELLSCVPVLVLNGNKIMRELLWSENHCCLKRLKLHRRDTTVIHLREISRRNRRTARESFTKNSQEQQQHRNPSYFWGQFTLFS